MQHSEVAKKITEKAKKLGESFERYETTLATPPSFHSFILSENMLPPHCYKDLSRFFDADWRKRRQWQT